MDTQKTNWLLVALLLVAGLLSAAQFGKLTLTLPLLETTYPGSFASVLVSVVGMVGIVFGAMAGALVAKAGISRVLFGALLLGGALSLFQATLPALPIFALSRAIEGFSHLAIVVAAPTLMASVSSDRDRPVVMGIWASFFGISLALTAAILPGLLALGGLPAVFLAHGLGMIIIALGLFRFLPRSKHAGISRVSYLAEHKAIYTTPKLLIAGGGFGFYTILYIAFLAVLPQALDIPLWTVSAMPLVSLGGTFAAGFLARYISPPLISMAGFGLTICVMSAFLVASNPVIPALVLMLVMGLIPGASFATIPHFNARAADRARATGGIAQLGNVGTTLGTPIFVLLNYVYGMPGIVIAAVVFCISGIVALAVLRQMIRKLENN